jgi:hypothetical protein
MKIKKATLRKYIEFLSELESAEPESDTVDFNSWFPHDVLQDTGRNHLVLREMITPFTYGDSGLVSTPPRETARQALKAKLRDAQKLIICDPYVFVIPQDTTETEYVKQLLSILPMNTLRVLEIAYSGRKSPRVVQELKKQIPASVSLKLLIDGSLHDRVWIVNDSRAFIVGTSFGSIGKKVAFIIDLPDDDFVTFKKHITNIRKWS